jgi:hypothetical protein
MECPSCIVDSSVNREHHRYAIANAMLGPADPSLPNAAFWKELAKRWEVGLADALSRRCNNCENYIDTQQIQECIQRHGSFDITSLGEPFATWETLVDIARFMTSPVQQAGFV